MGSKNSVPWGLRTHLRTLIDVLETVHEELWRLFLNDVTNQSGSKGVISLYSVESSGKWGFLHQKCVLWFQMFTSPLSPRRVYPLITDSTGVLPIHRDVTFGPVTQSHPDPLLNPKPQHPRPKFRCLVREGSTHNHPLSDLERLRTKGVDSILLKRPTRLSTRSVPPLWDCPSPSGREFVN